MKLNCLENSKVKYFYKNFTQISGSLMLIILSKYVDIIPTYTVMLGKICYIRPYNSKQWFINVNNL